MALLVAWLFVETYRVVARERRARQGGFVTHTLHKERCTYATISAFFALSYIWRWIFNKYFYGCDANQTTLFEQQMAKLACYLLEGASMGVLMYFHMTNFRQGGLFSTSQEDELAYISIMPNEYHRFDTESVDNHSLADPSSKAEEMDSERARSRRASLSRDEDSQFINPRPVLNLTTSKSDNLS